MAPERPRALRRLAQRVIPTPARGEPAPGMREHGLVEGQRVGAQHIGDLVPRTLATVRGEVRAVTLRPADQVAALEAELWDGTDALHLVWLGRRSIPGISAGVHLAATGRVTRHRGALTIFNPSYEIIPRDGRHGG